jgi:Uma2 family endonuclease
MAARAEVIAETMPANLIVPAVPGVFLPPMTLPFTFRPGRPLTDQELLDFGAANSALDFEVDADGTVRVMSPSKANGSRLNQILSRELSFWALKEQAGEVFGPDLGVRFEDGVLRAPDAAWLSSAKWQEHKIRAVGGREFPTICPEFIAELRSPRDRAWEVEATMEFWISRGAELAWLIDPQRKLAMIYTPGAEPRTLLSPEFLEGEGSIAGFRIEMREFWE